MAFTRTKYHDIQDRRKAILIAASRVPKSITDLMADLTDKDDPTDTGPNYYTVRADLQELLVQGRVTVVGKEGKTKLFRTVMDEGQPGLAAQWPMFFVTARDTPNLRDVIIELADTFGAQGVPEVVSLNATILAFPEFINSVETELVNNQEQLNELRKQFREGYKLLKRKVELIETMVHDDELWSARHLMKLNSRDDRFKYPGTLHEQAEQLSEDATEFMRIRRTEFNNIWSRRQEIG